MDENSLINSDVGPYHLRALLGEGGFGAVYLAEQKAPVRRLVALKVIRSGRGSREVLARFEAERQILALLEHPNIATVYDAGVSESGFQYFVMELVRGEPITYFCEHERVSIDDRVRLMIQVCGAVQHAHTKGIIHRDLKPTNILVALVDGRPTPKVIDFGVAKALYRPVADSGQLTEIGQIIGTPEYMSPEQARGSPVDVDTRADIYALGAILYELLTGKTPIDAHKLRTSGYAAALRLIEEETPLRPSVRVMRAKRAGDEFSASRKGSTSASLSRDLRGDLDWITMRCLEKERARRYDSAGALARDLERYLADEPVEARPPSTVYRTMKFVRRHRASVVAGAVVVMALIVGLGAALIGLRSTVRARDAEAAARREAESALAFISEMFGAVDPRLAKGRDVKVAEILDPAAEKVGQAFTSDAEGEAVVRGVLGQAYSNLTRYPEALREFERAWDLHQKLGQEDDPQALALLQDWGATLVAAGDVARALDLLQRAWERRSATIGPTHPDTLATRSLLAYAKQVGGDLDAAMADIQGVVQDQVKTVGPNDRATLESMCSLADMLGSAGKHEEALRVAREVSTRAVSAHGAESDLALMAQSIEAELLGDLGRDEEAAKLLEQVVRGKEKRYGPNHPETLISLDVLAGTVGSLGQEERAIALSREVVDRATQVLGEAHASTLTYMNNLAQELRRAGRLAEAEPVFHRVIELRRQVEGPQAEGTLVALSNLGLLLLQRGAPEEALPLFQEAADGFRSTVDPDHYWMLGVALLNLGRCQTALRRYPDAEATLLDAHARLSQSLGATHRRTEQARAALAELYRDWGRPQQAASWGGSK